jgi:uncharacterized protein (TIGR00255 family)
MLLSMTGYGAGQVDKGGASVAVEVRSVNNRYLKLYSRLPEGYAALEPRIEEVVRQQIRRGSVQLNVEVRRAATAEDYQVNTELVRAYVRQLTELQKELGTASINLDGVLALPGAICDASRSSSKSDEDWPLIKSALGAALQDLQTMRTREGEAMHQDLTTQASDIARCADAIETLAPGVVEAYQMRLVDRLDKLLERHEVKVEPADVVREVGILAERADISEEIVRLRSHLEQFSQVMSSDESGSGRKLEFLVQELLRETNTIGSKANDAEIAKHVVHVKTCIERIREMVQNVE